MSAPSVERRGRLFRKYVVLFVALVSGALVVSGALEIYFSYQENKVALAQLQREKALAAAERIEQFVKEIERQIGWTTHPQLVTGKATLEQRRVEFFRLQRQAPAVTEVSQLDAAGREQLRVSRLAMDMAGSQADFSKDPRFLEAREGRTYFSPVYFRKESEPYMTRGPGEWERHAASPWPRSTSSSSGTSCLRSRSARPDTPSWSTPTASSSPIPTSAWCSRRAMSRSSSTSGRPARPRARPMRGKP